MIQYPLVVIRPTYVPTLPYPTYPTLGLLLCLRSASVETIFSLLFIIDSKLVESFKKCNQYFQIMYLKHD